MRRRALAPLLLTLLTLAACGHDSSPSASHAGHGGDSAPSATAPRGAPDQTYRLRGRITRLPAPGATTREISVAHEAIPDFKGPNGDVIGMDAMTMPFAVAPAVALADLAPGDVIEMRLELRWSGNPPALVAQIDELPADTKLAFESP